MIRLAILLLAAVGAATVAAIGWLLALAWATPPEEYDPYAIPRGV